MVKYFFLIMVSTFLVTLNADVQDENTFPFIKPVSVEYEPLAKKINSTSPTKKTTNIKDDDNDGVSNINDKCAKTKRGSSVDETGCEPDSDGDGIKDSVDECSDTSRDFLVDNVGCPQTAMLKINFKRSEFIIPQDAFSKIKEFSEFLKDNQEYQAIIYGYTASVDGETKSNKELSQNRARAVMDILIVYGVKLTKLTAIGMGAKNPIADNETQEGRAKNRRIEVELLH